MNKPRVLVLADVPHWAWGFKAAQYALHLADEYEITVAYHAAVPPFHDFDLVHLFEVSQLRARPEFTSARIIAGLTANVWRTWGAEQMHTWAGKVNALHGNSLLLCEDLRQFHEHVFYTPNGVDTKFWHRGLGSFFQRSRVFTACHVGKPNPRKGADLIIEACRRVDVPLLLCQRTSKQAIPPDDVRDLYRTAWVQITMSDMDGTPNPMLESAACENALLSTRIGNMPEVIADYSNGFLVERTANALADRLAWLKARPETCIAMGKRARQEVVESWTWEQACARVRDMWRAVLGSV